MLWPQYCLSFCLFLIQYTRETIFLILYKCILQFLFYTGNIGIKIEYSTADGNEFLVNTLNRYLILDETNRSYY